MLSRAYYHNPSLFLGYKKIAPTGIGCYTVKPFSPKGAIFRLRRGDRVAAGTRSKRWLCQMVFSEQLEEGAAALAGGFCGASDIAAVSGQEFFQTDALEAGHLSIKALPCRSRIQLIQFAEIEILLFQHGCRRKHHGPFDDVGQLAAVAGPVVIHQFLERSWGKASWQLIEVGLLGELPMTRALAPSGGGMGVWRQGSGVRRQSQPEPRQQEISQQGDVLPS